MDEVFRPAQGDLFDADILEVGLRGWRHLQRDCASIGRRPCRRHMQQNHKLRPIETTTTPPMISVIGERLSSFSSFSASCRAFCIDASLKFYSRAIPASATEAQAMRQRLRQTRVSHALLDLLDVVGTRQNSTHLMLQVGDRKTRARIGVRAAARSIRGSKGSASVLQRAARSASRCFAGAPAKLPVANPDMQNLPGGACGHKR